MRTRKWLRSWSRLLLWSHVVGVLGFYITIWFRTLPGKRANKLRTKARPACDAEPIAARTIKTTPSVSIIVPARNEERNIRRCVTSLLAQDYENYEVIVVDDGSTDGTERILDEIAKSDPHADRLWVLRLKDLPAGWAGKPHALHSGVQEAHGDWLLFTDADTWHATNALRTAITSATEEQADLYSLGTAQELPTFWDRVMMPMAYLGIGTQYPINKVNDPHSHIAIANGQYILLRRSVYEITGGYARPELRSTLLDDRDLARVVKDCGFRLHLDDGRNLVHTHMYEGLGEIWRGWRKNAFLGSRGGPAFFLLMLIGLPMVSIVPFLLPLISRAGRNRPERISAPEAGLAAVLELVPLLTYRLRLNKELKVPWYYAFSHPLAAALFECILAQSAWRVLTRRGVDWRGRQYYHDARK
jgi:chlorobactene glucosyltransferase